MKMNLKRAELLLLILFDEHQVSVFQDKLKEYGYQNIISCTQGEEAVKKLASDKFSLVIIDPELQGKLNGIDLGRKIRQKFNLPIIYLSRLQDEKTFNQALETKPIAFLNKPVNWNELRMAIESSIFRNHEIAAINDKKDIYRHRFDDAPLPCLVMDANAKLTDVNNAWIELSGYSSEEVIGKWFGDFIPALFHQNFREHFEALTKKGKIHGPEYELLKKNGQKVTVSFEGNLQYGQKKEDVSIYCILNDITEKQRIKDRLEESEQRFRILFEEAPLGYQSLAVNGSIFYVNNTWCNLTGYSKKEVIGKWFGDFLTPVNKERFRANFSVFKQKGIEQDIQYEMIKKDGSIIFVLIDSKVRYNEEGDYIQSHCILKDITAQKVIEKKLLESEKKFSNLIESAGDIIYILDHDLKYIYGNNECLKRYGLTREELIGKNYRDLHSTESIEEFNEKIRTIQKSCEPVIYEHQSFEDGRYFLRTLSPVINPETKVIESITVISKDITGLKKTEQALQKRENEIRTITDNIPGLVSYVDANGHYRFINRQYEEWFGISSEEFIGKHYREVLGREAFEQIKEYINKTLSGKSITFEGKLSYARGGIRWVNAEYIPDFDDKGKVTGFFALVTDITERKKAEEELERSESRYRSLVESSTAGIASVNAEGKFILVNRRMCKMTGYSRDEILGRSFTDFLHPADMGIIMEIFKNAAQNPNFEPHLEFRVIHKDGHIVECFAGPSIIWEKGEISGFNAIVQDITERKRMEENLQESQAWLSNAMEIARLGYWDYDVVKDIFTFNDHFYSIFNTSAEKVGGYSMSYARYAELFVHPEDRHLVGSEIQKVLETKDHQYSRKIEHRMIYADGSTGYISVRLFIVKDDQGRTIRTYGANQDITERKMVEKALEESEAMLRIINENVNDIIWRIDADTRITYISPSVQRILGYSPEEVLGQPILNFIAKEYHYSAANNIRKRASEKIGFRPVYYEYEMVTRDGRKMPIEVSSSPIRDEQGNLVGFAGVTRDISERKKAESELQASETRFKAFMDYIPVMTYMKNKEGKYLYGNKATLKFAGKTLNKFIGAEVTDLYPGNTGRLMKQMDKKVLITGKPVELDELRYVYDNQEGWFREFKFPITLPGGETIIGGWQMEITGRREAEEALKKSEAQYKDLVEKAGIAIMTDDVNGNIKYFNREFTRLFGYTISELKNKSKETLFNKKDLKSVIAYYRQRMKGEKIPDSYEIRGIRKNGDEIWIEIKITLLRERNKIIGTRNYLWDITERKKIQEAIKNSETRFRELFNNMSSGVAVYKYDPKMKDFVFKDMNRAGMAISRVKNKKDIINRCLLDCFPGVKELGLYDALHRVNNSSKSEIISGNEYHDDRMNLFVENFVYKLPSGELVVVFDDIGERVFAEKSLLQSYEQIRKLSQHLENIREEERKYIAGELHDELGQILTAVKMDVSWIRNKMPPERKGIKKRAVSTIQIIDEAISKIQRLSMELRPRMLDDLGLLETLKAYLTDYQKRTNIPVRYQFPVREPKVISGQEISVFRIIQEALNNIARHARATEIIMEMHKKGDKLSFNISDNGIGISEEQIHSSDSLGIMIMRDRVSQWNGNIEINGKPGKGTTINVEIPL